MILDQVWGICDLLGCEFVQTSVEINDNKQSISKIQIDTSSWHENTNFEPIQVIWN